MIKVIVYYDKRLRGPAENELPHPGCTTLRKHPSRVQQSFSLRLHAAFRKEDDPYVRYSTIQRQTAEEKD